MQDGIIYKKNKTMRTRITILFLFMLISIGVKSQELVKDIIVGGVSSGSCEFTDVNGTIFFEAGTSENGHELWKSDGTEAGTVMVKDICPGRNDSFPRELTNVNGTLFFRASAPTGESELWKSDGTEAGTVIVKDINPSQGSYGGSYPLELVNVNGVLFFLATHNSMESKQLWKSDGTESGTVMVKYVQYSEPRDLFEMNGILYFTSQTNSGGRDLWKTDGTEAGTVMVKDICNKTDRQWNEYSFFTNVNGMLYFIPVKDRNNPLGAELWKSDGTEQGTVFVANIRVGESNYPEFVTALNGVLYFRAKDDIHGEELWRSDGTLAGTIMVKDIKPGIESSYPFGLIGFKDNLYFSANNGVNGFELFKSDGTESGTNLVKDIFIGTENGNPQGFLVFNNMLYFTAYNNYQYKEWKTDGTSFGTVEHPNDDLNYQLTIGGNSESPGYVITNSTLYYSASSGSFAGELWKFDGENLGTTDFENSQFSIYPNPTTSKLNLQFPNDKIINKVIIIDVTGKIVLQQNQNTTQINVEKLSAGVYIIKAYLGNEKFTSKFVKK
jgi:ELWxxDGT repeat protein